MKSRAMGISSLAACLFLVGCGSGSKDNPLRHEWEVMGTFAALSLPTVEKDNSDQLVTTARETMEKVNQLVTVYSPESEISRLNHAAGTGKRISLSPITAELLDLSIRYNRRTGGAFDATIFPLIQLWGFNGGNIPVTVPDQSRIEEVRAGFGHSDLILTNGIAEITGRTTVDLGGIAKGYAVDLCYEHLMTNSPSGFMIDLGGNIRCSGFSRDNKPWRIGVRNPFDRSQLVGVVELTGGMAIATSGNYERFVEIEGERYAHIIDPRSGYPVKGVAGVTVLSSTAVEADALSTAFFVLGLDKATELLDKFPGCNVLFVPDRHPMEIHVSPRFQELFKALPQYEAAVRVIGE